MPLGVEAEEVAPALQASASDPAGPAIDVEAAVRVYLDRQTPEQKARSDAYFEGGYWLQLWGFLYGLAVAFVFLGTRLSRSMRALAVRLTQRRPLQTWLYGAQYVVAAAVLTYPLALYQGFFREHQYGFATQTFPQWMRDQIVGLAVSLVLVPPLLVVLYGVVRRAPRSWWLWGSAVSLVALVFLLLISPVYVDPLFNKYEPLADVGVKEEILRLARAGGIETGDVYQFDASRQTTRISANVSGFMGTMSIRLNDNLLERCSLPEIKAVMAHEMGHYVLNHVYEGIVFFAIVLVGGFAFLRGSFEWAVGRWGRRWAIEGIGDVAGLPLLAALLSVYFFVLTPVLNIASRTNEAEADLYGLQAAREPDGFAEVALKVGEYRKLEPGPVEEWLFFDHPSGRSRIRMAMRWKAEGRHHMQIPLSSSGTAR